MDTLKFILKDGKLAQINLKKPVKNKNGSKSWSGMIYTNMLDAKYITVDDKYISGESKDLLKQYLEGIKF